MDLIKQHNEKYQFFADITGEAMRVHRKFHSGLLESAYEAAMQYLLTQRGMKVERQKYLPIFWDDVQLSQSYRLDLVVDDVIVELKAVDRVGLLHRRQLWNYMHLTHTRYGMLVNFGGDRLYSEWYERDQYGHIEQVHLL
ncbi:MAG: GxxExxY protein [Prevotella sp.]|nr:GxxExxY protein [Prevotella sp.]